MRRVRALLILGAALLLAFLLQSTILTAPALLPIRPNLLLVIVVCFSLLGGSTGGILLGFAAGLLQDVFFGNVLGFYALVYGFVGYLSGKFINVVYPRDAVFPAIFTGMMDLVSLLAGYVFLFLIQGRFFFGSYLLHQVLPEFLSTALAALLIYPPVAFIFRKYLRKPVESESNFADSAYPR